MINSESLLLIECQSSSRFQFQKSALTNPKPEFEIELRKSAPTRTPKLSSRSQEAKLELCFVWLRSFALSTAWRARASCVTRAATDMTTALVFAPTADPRVFVAPDGTRHAAPAGGECLPPGDAGLTRRVKSLGPSWAIIEKRGRKAFSKGLWAPRELIQGAKLALEAERSTPAYAKKRAAAGARREHEQAAYVVSFEVEVLGFLRFAPRFELLARNIARRVTEHATPVGSGTVARTERISIDRRAESAVIAWMRHQTTAYDRMAIPRVAGKRREVRRELATISRAILDLHRRDAPHAAAACPLCTAVPLPTS